MLLYYDVKLPVTVSADLSQNGLGIVIIQNNKPIAYCSRALTDTERNYRQIEKELLALLYAYQKFDSYKFGREFIAETDHKPLVTIMKKPIHTATPRIQNMLLKLQRHNINLVYKPGKELYIADTLSRAYQQADESDISDYNEYHVMNIEVLSNTRLDELHAGTNKDHTSNVLATLINKACPDKYYVIPKEAQPYYSFRDELSMSNDIIMRGHRFMIPKSLQTYYVEQLHKGHPGIKATNETAC